MSCTFPFLICVKVRNFRLSGPSFTKYIFCSKPLIGIVSQVDVLPAIAFVFVHYLDITRSYDSLVVGNICLINWGFEWGLIDIWEEHFRQLLSASVSKQALVQLNEFDFHEKENVNDFARSFVLTQGKSQLANGLVVNVSTCSLEIETVFF